MHLSGVDCMWYTYMRDTHTQLRIAFCYVWCVSFTCLLIYICSCFTTLLKIEIIDKLTGWGFCATRIEIVIVIATRLCSTPSATCWTVAIVRSSTHIHSCASRVAIGQWLTQVILLISNISAPSLVRGPCQVLKKVQGYDGRDPALNYRLLAMVFCVWVCFMCWVQVTNEVMSLNNNCLPH